jgi:hypothetical protein
MKQIILILWILLAAATQQLYAQNAPISMVGNVVSTGSSVILPITASNFVNIGSCNLELNYDPSIATVTSVTTSTLLAGGFSGLDFYIPAAGTIRFGWYKVPGVTVPDNSVVFNIAFSKVANGISPITWSSDDNACIFADGNYNNLNDTPQSTYYIPGSVQFQGYAPTTIAPAVTSCPGGSVSVPVKVTSFNTIGAVSLTLNYNPAVLTYVSSVNTSGFPGLFINSPSAGTIIIGGYTTATNGVTYPDYTTLFTLNFTYIGGSTGLNWYDDGGSCEYTGPQGTPTLTDTPQSTYYLDGSVGPNPNTDWTGIISSSWENTGNWTCGLPKAAVT